MQKQTLMKRRACAQKHMHTTGQGMHSQPQPQPDLQTQPQLRPQPQTQAQATYNKKHKRQLFGIEWTSFEIWPAAC